jgi:hypothetical protein
MKYYILPSLIVMITTTLNSCDPAKSVSYPIDKNYKPDDEQLYQKIVRLDSLFFGAYNTCSVNLDQYGSYFSAAFASPTGASLLN